MHGIDLKTQMDIVYHALNDTSKGIIDASCCGAFKRKSAEEARDLIEHLAKCNMKAPSEFSRSIGRGRGIMELSKMTAWKPSWMPLCTEWTSKKGRHTLPMR